jgi:hypothetical protein
MNASEIMAMRRLTSRRQASPKGLTELTVSSWK